MTCLPVGIYSIRYTGLLRVFMEDNAWVIEEELTQSSPAWAGFQNQNEVPVAPPRSPSNPIRTRPPSAALDTSLYLIWSCSPPVPGWHQRDFSENDLNEDLVDFDQSYEEPLPRRNPFIVDEADESAKPEMESTYSKGNQSAHCDQDQARRLDPHRS